MSDAPLETLEPHSPGAGRDVDLHLAYAEATVLLIEALMLVLIERKVLSIEDLAATVETAIETKEGFITAGVHPDIALMAAGILRRMGNSLAAASRGTGS